MRTDINRLWKQKIRKGRHERLRDALMDTVLQERVALHGLTYPEVITALGETADLFLANYSGITKIPVPVDHRKRLSEEQTFEICYRRSKGESMYRIARSLGFTTATVSRVINGDCRYGRNPTSFVQRLQSDNDLKLRYELWVKRRELNPPEATKQ